MDYAIRTKPSELDSTGYIELGPGKYSGKHWQDGFLFVWEDAFGMAEGIVMKYFNDYDHFGINEIPKSTGLKIVSEWQKVASELKIAEPLEFQNKLNLDVVYREYMQDEIIENRESIVELLNSLSQKFKSYYETEEWVCILGM